MKRISFTLMLMLMLGLMVSRSSAQMQKGMTGQGMMGYGSTMTSSEEGAESGETSMLIGRHPCHMMGQGMMGREKGQDMMGCGMGQGMMGCGMNQGMMGCGMGQGMMGCGMNQGMMGCGMGQGMMGCGMGQDMMGYGMGCGMMGRGYGRFMMGPGKMGCGMGMGMMGYGYPGAQKKFLDETVDLRREMHLKRFEYFEALRNSETDGEAVAKIEREIKNIQKGIYEKSLE